nr:DDE-type integrase/transposase/recombinase [Sphingobacterium sp. FBM7-1]
MWQTDFTYFKIVGWGWYYLSTVLDDYSRYIIHWELCDSMNAKDVKRTVNTAIEKARLKSKAKPKLLSDNGPCYVSNELKTYLKEDMKMKQVHGRPMHPQTQGKIERYHRTMKNLTPADVYCGRSERILEKRQQVKIDSLNKRRQLYNQQKLINL